VRSPLALHTFADFDLSCTVQLRGEDISLAGVIVAIAKHIGNVIGFSDRLTTVFDKL